MNRRWCKAGGFSLIEVLVALLVLAFASLGAGATMLAARRAGQQSMLTSNAVHLASRAADSMRANAPAMAAADPDNPYLQLDYDALADGPPAPPLVIDCSSACDSAALAAADLADWRRELFDHYPLGRIRICRDGAWWDPAAASLRWDCDGSGAAPVVVKIGWRQRLGKGQQADGDAAGAAPLLVALPIAGKFGGGTP